MNTRLLASGFRWKSGGRLHVCLVSAVALLLCTTATAVASSQPNAPVPDASGGAGAGRASSSQSTRVAETRVAEFNTGMLAGHSHINSSRFAEANKVTPGIYNVDVYLNQQKVTRTSVRFAMADGQSSPGPCLTVKLLAKMQILGQIPDHKAAHLQRSEACVQLSELIPGATMQFDKSRLRLDFTVPQTVLKARPRGYVAPAAWDDGVPAFWLHYNLNGDSSFGHGRDREHAFLGLSAGLNLGLWHLRHRSIARWTSSYDNVSASHDWNNTATYLERPLAPLDATLTLGDSFTDAGVFDSVALRGVELTTADGMRPPSRRNYVPVIRGTADTNAHVTVRQNGSVIYETNVPPGPFRIDDLYPPGSGNDLVVTVTEANGQKRTYRVPYSSVPQLLRPGVTRFDVSAGNLRNQRFGDDHYVGQATLQHGFNNLLTGYGGLRVARNYMSAKFGNAFNTPIGALAVDATWARLNLPKDQKSGWRFGLSWSKTVPSTHTRLGVAAYRYSTKEFYDLTDAVTAHGAVERGLRLSRVLERPRNNLSVRLRQPLGRRYGSFFATASLYDYWNQDRTSNSYRVGYNNSFHQLSYGVSVAHTDLNGHSNTRGMLHFSLPLGAPPHSPYFAFNFLHDSDDNTRELASLNGDLGEYNQFRYNLSASHGNHGTGTAGSANASYRMSKAVVSAGFSQGKDYSRASVGARGGVVVHPGGVTLGRIRGQTIGIVHAPHAAGAHIQNAHGVTVGDSGYALVPFLTPYRFNTVRLDPKDVPLGVNLHSTSAKVAPYKGAVAMFNFKTNYGRPIIVHINRPGGKPAPFGARVRDAEGETLGTVGQGSTALLRVGAESGRVTVQWRNDKNQPQSCTFAYKLPDGQSDTKYPQIHVTCAGKGKTSQESEEQGK